MRTTIRAVDSKDKRSLSYFEDTDTIAKLFAAIDREIARQQNVRVKYDLKYGFPKEISVSDPKSNGWAFLNSHSRRWRSLFLRVLLDVLRADPGGEFAWVVRVFAAVKRFGACESRFAAFGTASG